VDRALAGLRSGQPPSVIDDLADVTWDRELDDLFLRIGHRFGRADLRRRMRDYIRALLGPVGRKNGWQRAFSRTWQRRSSEIRWSSPSPRHNVK
jgi:hypothetical protein